jgi:hypothetical protein
MKESYGEGVANHTGSESCVGFPQGGGEALTGVRAGQVLSREIIFNFRVPTFWDRWKAIPCVSPSRDMHGPCAVGDLEHVRKHLAREPGDPMFACGMRVLQAATESPRT